MRNRIVAGLAALTVVLGGILAVSNPATAEPPPAKPGMTVVEVPAYPGVEGSVKTYIQVSTPVLEAAKNGTPKRLPEGQPAKGLPPAPQPPVANAVELASRMMVTCTPGCRHYGRISETSDADPAYGLSVDITTGKPFTQSGANHSLGEVAVQSADQQDIVEIGWIVNTARRADGNPTLFAYHWIDGVPQGYETGFVDYAPNPVNLVAGLPKPVNKNFTVSSTSTHFWVGYDGSWVAYLDKTRFGADEFGLASDQVALGQAFFEVYADGAGEEHPCDDMGTGWDSDPFVSGTASVFNFAWIGSVTAVNVTGGIATNPGGITGDSNAYHFATTSANSGRGSGPGWNAAGTAPGTKDAC